MIQTTQVCDSNLPIQESCELVRNQSACDSLWVRYNLLKNILKLKELIKWARLHPFQKRHHVTPTGGNSQTKVWIMHKYGFRGKWPCFQSNRLDLPLKKQQQKKQFGRTEHSLHYYSKLPPLTFRIIPIRSLTLTFTVGSARRKWAIDEEQCCCRSTPMKSSGTQGRGEAGQLSLKLIYNSCTFLANLCVSVHGFVFFNQMIKLCVCVYMYILYLPHTLNVHF